MNLFLVVGLALLLGTILFIFYRYYQFKAKGKKLDAKRFEQINPLREMLLSGKPLSTEDIHPYAASLRTRETTYQLLKAHNRLDLFPPVFNTLIKGAEASLASWLEFPTELDAIPEEMEHVKRVSIDFDGNNNMVHYQVFRYRVKEPHWAAKSGWILGVVGPYFDDSQPYDFPHSTFSRISSTETSSTPEEEVQWVHGHISLRRK